MTKSSLRAERCGVQEGGRAGAAGGREGGSGRAGGRGIAEGGARKSEGCECY